MFGLPLIKTITNAPSKSFESQETKTSSSSSKEELMMKIHKMIKKQCFHGEYESIYEQPDLKEEDVSLNEAKQVENESQK